MHRLLRVTLLFALMACPGFAKEGDWGYAHIFYIKKALSSHWSAISGSQLTWRDDFSDFYFAYADAGIGYKLHPGWSIGAIYRQGWWKIGEEWETERRPLVNLTWSGAWEHIRLSNQARIEFRDYQWNKEDDIRIRNRTRIEFPQELFPGGVKPFVEEEFFYGGNRKKIEMNWLTAGLYFKATHSVKLKAGYRWIAIIAGSEWENRNQLVTGMAVLF
jgi:hypothetical protein